MVRNTVTTDTGKRIHRKFISDMIVFQKERKTASKIGDIITLKNRHCLIGVDGKYIQWNEILRDVLNGKLQVVQNQRSQSDSESEEGEIDDEKSDFENHNSSEKDGRYRPITKSPEDELILHTDGEINPGEKQTHNKTTENEKIRRSNRESRQPNRYGGITYTKKRSIQTANEAFRLHPRVNPNTGDIKTVTQEDPEGRKSITVHIPDRSFGDIVNQT